MIRVQSLTPLDGRRLALEFSDGSCGIVDLFEDVASKSMRTLKDETCFRRAVLEHGAVEWPGTGVGIATEYLYALAHGLPVPITPEQARTNEREMSQRTRGEP